MKVLLSSFYRALTSIPQSPSCNGRSGELARRQRLMEQVAQLVSEQVSDVYRVLIVDGDENLLALDRLALSKNGFEVETATSASDALGMMADRMPDLVVLDVVLPDLSSWELLRRVRASSDEVAVMLLTGRDSDVDKVRGLDLGADDFPTYSDIPEAGALVAQHTLTRIQSDVVVRQAGRGRMMSVVRIPA
jgi:PleD family two-component response regulator